MFKDIHYDKKTGELFTLKMGTKQKLGYNQNGYVAFERKGIRYLAHRYIWELYNSKIPDGLIIDHISGDRKDNRLSNLRLCTQAQNKRNRKIRKDNTSGYKGVTFAKLRNNYVKKKPWRVWLQHNYKAYSRHGFATAEDAARHYNEKAVEFFGEFARLNVIPD